MPRHVPVRSSLIPPAAILVRMLSFLFMLGVIGITIYRISPWRRPRPPAVVAVADADRAPLPDDAKRQGAKPDGSEPHHTAAELPASSASATSSDDAEHADNPAQASDAEPSLDAEETAALPPAENNARDVNADSDRTQPADDRDPRQMAAFRWEIREVNDQSTLVRGYELPAYRRLFQWISEQSVKELASRHPPEAVFQQLHDHPQKHRGELLSLELRVRRVAKDQENDESSVGVKTVYQLWGWPTSGSGWLYVVVAPELPPGFPEGSDIDQVVRVYGYFFKLQGYQPANAKPHARPLVAPLIVGKMEWVRTVARLNPAETMLSYVALAIGGGGVAWIIGFWVVSSRRKKIARARRVPAWTVEPTDPSDEPSWSAPDEDAPWEEPRDESFDWRREV